MLNSYYIKKIYLENFKSVDSALINFEGKDLIVLDGPNGFGKTTIFDAIELVLTGKIRRINSNKIASTNRGYSDHLLSKDQNKPTIVKLEFISKEDQTQNIVLVRVLEASYLSSSQKRPGEFGNYKLYVLDDFYEAISEEKQADSKEVSKLFGLENIEDSFMMYNYVEQEESGHFFKQNEIDRMNAVSKLFNIEKEILQKSYMEKMKNRLVRERNSVEKDIEREEGQNNELSKESLPEVAFQALITDEDIKISWDKEVFPGLNKAIKEEFLSELDSLSLLVENFSDFKIEQKNREMDNVSNNVEKLKAMIVFSHFSDNFAELEKRYTEQKKLQRNLDIIRNREILDKNLDWDIIRSRTESDSYNEIVARISSLKKMHSSANNMSKLIQQMNISRENLNGLFQEYYKKNPSGANSCPLCGDEKESFEKLISDIEMKTEGLSSELDGTSKQVKTELEMVYQNYLNETIQTVQLELQNSKLLEEDFIEQLRSVSKVVPDFNKAKEWFSMNEIDLNSHINQEETVILNLNEKIDNLKKEIQSKKMFVNEVCKDNMQSFQRLYSDRLQKKDHILQNLSVESIKKKKLYIEYQYYLQMNEAYKRTIKLKRRLVKLNNIIESITRILEVYNKNINVHRRRMISDVEIPFYIYSGKIIQTHQRGIGVFIREERESGKETSENQLKAINFVPPGKTDHDIVHSFSSGQLSSTVIAFTLALNKVYSRQSISTLLIDDPVQTMDEMNMVSLVDLLRNDFSDRQIILSTHEEKVSLYLRYKFFKYGYSVSNVNVKDEFSVII